MSLDVIPPLIDQHARDAAFYWRQIDVSRFSPIVTQQKLKHFHRQLDAHLDGLCVAGESGWKAAYKNLTRWKTQGEAFVCMWLALGLQNEAHFDALRRIISEHPDTTVRGVIGAMARLPYAQAEPLLNLWLNSSNELLLEIALRAFGAQRKAPGKDLSELFVHTNPRIRAACCQLTGKLRLQAHQSNIHQALVDIEAQVREQAALANFWLSPKASITDELYELLTRNLQNTPKRGLASVIAKRRMELLARMLGHTTSRGSERLPQLLSTLPERLRILMLAHHGDPAQLPYLLHALENETTARLAFWAIGLITGIDTTAPELCAPAPEPKEGANTLSTATDDADVGLEWPNVPIVVAACQPFSLKTGPLLMGQTPTIKHCLNVMATAPQAARFAASWHWARLDAKAPQVDTRYMEIPALCV